MTKNYKRRLFAAALLAAGAVALSGCGALRQAILQYPTPYATAAGAAPCAVVVPLTQDEVWELRASCTPRMYYKIQPLWDKCVREQILKAAPASGGK